MHSPVDVNGSLIYLKYFNVDKNFKLILVAICSLKN